MSEEQLLEQERAKYGPIPVSDRAKAEADAKMAEAEAEKLAAIALEAAIAAGLPPPVVPYSSLFIFSSENGFRLAVHNVWDREILDISFILSTILEKKI